ncbi:MAG: hypothetical protein ACI31F_05900 [Muribaculaceae bacterium]
MHNLLVVPWHATASQTYLRSKPEALEGRGCGSILSGVNPAFDLLLCFATCTKASLDKH